MKIFDCFTFYNELDLLDIRLHQLWDEVDCFVIVEGDLTYAGKRKPSFYLDNHERYAWAKSKIIHVTACLLEHPESRWVNEAMQRDAIIQGLGDAEKNDIVCVSCVDEIFSGNVFEDLRSGKVELPVLVEQNLHYYYLNGRCTGSARIFPCPVITEYSELGDSVHAFWDKRYSYNTYPNGGWHFSFLGGVEIIREKIEAYSHNEYDKDEFKDIDKLEKAINSGDDLFDREGVTDIEYITLDDSYPSYILANIEKFSHLIKAPENQAGSGMIFDQYSRYKACADLMHLADYAEGGSVLDIGSGPECLFGQFMPDARMTYVDPLIQHAASDGYIKGNVFSGELDGQVFDCVSAVDVLEHVPPDNRRAFIERLVSLAKKTIILGFPASDSTDAVAVDNAIADQYRRIYGQDYSWLDEHYRFGLPSLSETVELLGQQGWHCQSIGHGHAPWLQELLGYVVCAWDVGDLKQIVLDISDQFNRELYPYDFCAPYYRQFIVATREPLAPVSVPAGSQNMAAAENKFEVLMQKGYRRYFSVSMRLLANRERTVHERDVAQAERETVLRERDAIAANLDNVIAQRDVSVAQINLMKNSTSWRLTMPLRFLFRLFRHGFLSEDRQRISLALRKRYHRLPLPLVLKKAFSFTYHRIIVKTARSVRRLFVRAPVFRVPAIKPAEQVDVMSDYIVWGVIDWHFRHQRPQQLALAVAGKGRRVFYVSPNLIDDSRAGFEVEALDDSNRLFQVRLYVKNAPVIYTSVPDANVINQLRLSIGEVLDWAGCNQLVSLAQHPYWYEVAAVLPNSRLVYDCMDHHEGFGNNTAALVQLEKSLLKESCLTITTSDWLDQAVAEHAQRRTLIRNAGDYGHFSRRPDTIYRDPDGRRIIGYYGAIAEWFDLDLVASVAERFHDCCVLLIGADTANAAARLGKYKNIMFTGEVPYDQLPYYLYSFDVCMLPFKVIPLTLATNPVKAYEYLSAGKPVVAVNLPEMAQFGDLIYTAADQVQFLDAVDAVLAQAEPDDKILHRKEFAAGQTWGHRAESLIESAEASTADPEVSIVVVTYNNLDLTKICLASIDQYSLYEHIEIIVVDNASADGTQEHLESWVTGASNRKLILNEDNRGFAAANNQGLRLASGDYLVMLNNDTHVTPGWVRTLVNHLQRDPGTGLIGPVTNNIGNEAKIEIAYNSMSEMLVKSAAYTRRHLGEAIPLRTAAFFCVMLPRTTYDLVGELDEVFGRGFFEDDDYCRRIEAQGLRVECAEDVFIHHQLSASFDKMKQKDRQQLFEDNKKIYEARWGEWMPHSYRKFKQAATTDKTVPFEFNGQRYVEGACIVCGKPSRFFYKEESLWRESLNCEHCRTTSRYRSIARGMLRAISELAGIKADALSTLPKVSETRLHIYDTQPPFYYETCAYPLPDLVKAAGWIDIDLSQYKPGLAMGETISKGVANQNLECLTFADASLDIVITSDVMEHVRLDDLAHREIHRVLKPGGIYIFTVPHNRSTQDTLVRVQINDPDDTAKDMHLLEPEYHGDTNSDSDAGVLSYRVYGRDLDDYLQKLGFEVEYINEELTNLGILNTELYYCRKLKD